MFFFIRAICASLFNLYKKLFEPHNPMEEQSSLPKQDSTTYQMTLTASNLAHYVPEGFVLFLKIVQERLAMPDAKWKETMSRFMFLAEVDQDHKLPTNSGNYHDLGIQFHRHDVHTVSTYNVHLPKMGRFLSWNSTLPSCPYHLNCSSQEPLGTN